MRSRSVGRSGGGLVWWFLLRRVGFGRGSWVALVGLGVTAGLLAALVVSLSALALTGEQVADQALADKERSVRLQLPLADGMDPGLPTRLRNVVEATGAREVVVTITSFELGLDQSRPEESLGPVSLSMYVEGEDLPGDFPGRYELLEGQWPAGPGEVVITPKLQERLDGGVEGGVTMVGTRLEVVGIYRPAYQRKLQEVLAGPGTYVSLPAETIKRIRPQASGMATVYWSGGDDQAVLKALVAEAPKTRRDGVVDRGSLLKREELIAEPEESLLESNPLAFGMPVVLLGSTLSAMVVLLGRSRVRRQSLVAVGVGLSGRVVWSIYVVRCLVGLVAAIGIGIVVGVIVGAVGRPVLDQIFYQPLSPVRVPADLVLVPVAAAVGFGGAVLSVLASRADTAGFVGRLPWGLIRWTVGVCLLVYTLPQISLDLDDRDLGLLTAGAVIGVMMFVPDTVRAATRLLPTLRVVPLLVRRQSRADGSRIALIAVMLAVGLATPFVSATYVASQVATNQAELVPEAPPGVLIADYNTPPRRLVDESIEVITRATGQTPLVLRYATSTVIDGQPALIRVRETGPDSGSTVLAIVPDIRAVEALLGAPLSQGDRDVLERGGVLSWSGIQGPVAVDSEALQGGKRSRGPELETVHAQAPTPSIAQLSAGLVLESTAERNQWRGRASYVMFRDLTDDQIRAADQALIDAQLSPRALMRYVPQAKAEMPVEWYVAIACLGFASFIAVAVTTTAQARDLRGKSRQMLAIGLSHTWAYRMLLTQLGIALLIGLVAACIAAALPVWWWANSEPDTIVFDIPTTLVATCATAALLAILAGAAIGLTRLRASDTTADD